jgi:hippurate hydrolase
MPKGKSMTIHAPNVMAEVLATRHHLHRFPEIGLSEFRTSDYVAEQLIGLGYEVTRGLAKTGVVATLRSGTSDRSIGIRADFDALPILEETGLPYASETPGVMHACGHDGHTAMLLGAAKILAERRNFDGVIHLIFQPAEENFGGARIMIEDGLFERFPCDAVFALHKIRISPLVTSPFARGRSWRQSTSARSPSTAAVAMVPNRNPRLTRSSAVRRS